MPIDRIQPLLQWGSEYQTSPVLKRSQVVRLRNGPVFECLFNTGINLVQYSDQQYLTGIQMVFRILDYHLNTGYLDTGQVNVCYSDASVIQI